MNVRQFWWYIARRDHYAMASYGRKLYYKNDYLRCMDFPAPVRVGFLERPTVVVAYYYNQEATANVVGFWAEDVEGHMRLILAYDGHHTVHKVRDRVWREEPIMVTTLGGFRNPEQMEVEWRNKDMDIKGIQEYLLRIGITALLDRADQCWDKAQRARYTDIRDWRYRQYNGCMREANRLISRFIPYLGDAKKGCRMFKGRLVNIAQERGLL